MKIEDQWPWNKFPDTKSQWETCLRDYKKALAEIETQKKHNRWLERDISDNHKEIRTLKIENLEKDRVVIK